ncbi:MAG: hypothetical protein RIE08_00960 [Acidimicrobiales bacterium]
MNDPKRNDPRSHHSDYTVTAHAVAERLGVTRAKVLEWIDSGRYPGATLVDGMWHIPVSELVADGVRSDRSRPANRTRGDFRADALDGGVRSAPTKRQLAAV